METMKYKDFLGSVEICLKDKCLHGKILFINDLVTYEAADLNLIEKEFVEAVDDYIETCESLKIEPFKSFSGSFNVRIGPELHQKLATYAVKSNEKINTVVKNAIKEYLNELDSSQEVHNHHTTVNVTIEKSLEEFTSEKESMENAQVIDFQKYAN